MAPIGLEQRFDCLGEIVAQRARAVAVVVKLVDEPDVVGFPGAGERDPERLRRGFPPAVIVRRIFPVDGELPLLSGVARLAELGFAFDFARLALLEKGGVVSEDEGNLAAAT